MSIDSQWPRYQVFLQEKPGAPHQHVGSVHAPDPEIALQNGRDVFVRRPACVNLWVVPAEAILAKTAQELENWHATQAVNEEELMESGNLKQPLEVFYLFSGTRQGGMQTLLGTVEAHSAEQALAKGLQEYSRESASFTWWVFPKTMVTCSSSDEVDSLFAPALDKPFRLSSDFHTVSTMRQIRAKKEARSE